MTIFPVSEEKNRWLQERMEALGIYEKDIEEKFIRSSGSGGQKVNKTSTCVYLRHIPTGIEVKWMRERSQSLNRFLARRELVKRIERLSGERTTDVEVKKTRRQKSKRKKRAKLKYGKMAGVAGQESKDAEDTSHACLPVGRDTGT
jgi:protein subunit release factor B